MEQPAVKKSKGAKEKIKKVKKPPKEKPPKEAGSSEQDPNKPTEKKVSKAKVCACERCGKGFVSWQNMKIHYTNVHKEDCVEKQYNTKCPYEGCGKSFFHRKTMLKHLEQDHGVQTEQEHYEFENMDAFLDWKESEEAENHVYYVKQRGLRFHKGWYDQHFYCQRDGSAVGRTSKGTA
ncbi:uncharacterized protein [Amphiura filiformis]|uniref:uncharacterized protein n=1 Tax=Amphiura filiformis TaxID=82378 RepID=UPI003B2167F6